MSAPQVVSAGFFMILNLRSAFFLCVLSVWYPCKVLVKRNFRYVVVSFCGRQVSSKRILYFSGLVKSEKRVVAVLISTPQLFAQLLTALVASCKRVAAVVVYPARV